jgi:hypothetical protein
MEKSHTLAMDLDEDELNPKDEEEYDVSDMSSVVVEDCCMLTWRRVESLSMMM